MPRIPHPNKLRKGQRVRLPSGGTGVVGYDSGNHRKFIATAWSSGNHNATGKRLYTWSSGNHAWIRC